MDRPESRIMTPGASLSIFGIGLLFQMLSCPFVFVFTQALQESPLGQTIMFALLLVWFSLPLLGVFGIIVGVKCYLRNVGTFSPLLGIALNALWLAVFGVICFYVFVLRVSA